MGWISSRKKLASSAELMEGPMSEAAARARVRRNRDLFTGQVVKRGNPRRTPISRTYSYLGTTNQRRTLGWDSEGGSG